MTVLAEAKTQRTRRSFVSIFMNRMFDVQADAQPGKFKMNACIHHRKFPQTGEHAEERRDNGASLGLQREPKPKRPGGTLFIAIAKSIPK
ncbi:MAG: hypothetical protein WC360_08760 [Opitutales bacterium]|jgi:hypothetical protein